MGGTSEVTTPIFKKLTNNTQTYQKILLCNLRNKLFFCVTTMSVHALIVLCN